ncbi:MAG: EthD family reductase [Rudaea sp.]
MVKLVALYRKPSDVEAFERDYFLTHVPLINKVPGLQRLEVSRVTGAPRGEPDFFMMAEMYFPDRETMDQAMLSPENIQAGKNLFSFARGLVTMMFVEDALDHS